MSDRQIEDGSDKTNKIKELVLEISSWPALFFGGARTKRCKKYIYINK
jgi:hypothetical protein